MEIFPQLWVLVLLLSLYDTHSWWHRINWHKQHNLLVWDQDLSGAASAPFPSCLLSNPRQQFLFQVQKALTLQQQSGGTWWLSPPLQATLRTRNPRRKVLPLAETEGRPGTLGAARCTGLRPPLTSTLGEEMQRQSWEQREIQPLLDPLWPSLLALRKSCVMKYQWIRVTKISPSALKKIRQLQLVNYRFGHHDAICCSFTSLWHLQ